MDGAQVRNANLAVERNAQAAFDGSTTPVYPPGQTDPVGSCHSTRVPATSSTTARTATI